MKQKILIGLPFILIIVLYIISQQGPKTILEKYNREIKELKADLKDINNEVKQYFSIKNKKHRKYLFLDPNLKGDLKDLIREKFIIQEQLSYSYIKKGDYFLNERYITDKKAPDKYKRFFKDLEHRNLTNEKVQILKHSKKVDANKVFKLMIETRLIALKYYNLASKALEDETSSIFRVKANNPILFPTPFILLDRGDELTKVLKDQQSNAMRKYLSERVKPSLHHKKGLCYRQLASFAYYLGVTKESQKIYINPVKKSVKTPQFYLDEGEKEFLITLAVDYLYNEAKANKKQTRYDKKFKKRKIKVLYRHATFNLAELYTWRFEHFEDYKKEYMLIKAEELLKKLTVSNEIKDFGKHDVKALLKLARVYYLISKLNLDQIRTLVKLMPLDSGGLISVTSKTESKLYFLKKALNIYKNIIIPNLHDKSLYYGITYTNMKQIKNEINSIRKR